jgi:hypothetical protein
MNVKKVQHSIYWIFERLFALNVCRAPTGLEGKQSRKTAHNSHREAIADSVLIFLQLLLETVFVLLQNFTIVLV